MADFRPFSKLVHQRFAELSKHELFVTSMHPDSLYAAYLSAFPEGTNPIYKERTEHDCSCCKNFIRNLGTVVAVVDGKLRSVWHVEGAESPYKEVAAALDALVTAMPIDGLFRSSERSYGAEETKQLLEDKSVKKWNHFHGEVAARHFTKEVDKVKGDYATTVQVFARGLEELSADAIQTVSDLIANNSLYRGEEHLPALTAFKKTQAEYLKLKRLIDKKIFVWANAMAPASRFRNTVIGTLVQDLSAGVDLEAAVRSFETKVAPTNYKRPTALITQRMVIQASETLKQLGLETALQRRFARLSDVSVNNVLWVDNSVAPKMKDGIEGLLMSSVVAPAAKETKAEEITITEFMATVLPNAASIELLVRNTHATNFMSLTAPVHPDSGRLFKWGNDFGWSYEGNITDSIKEKVKRAGGNTNAPLRVSLAWSNFDDLDLHCQGPDGHVYFGDKKGILDVDMNAGYGRSREPVENLSWSRPKDGVYSITVDQFSQREKSDVGFVLEVENDGQVQQFSHSQELRANADLLAFQLTVKAGKITNWVINPALVGGIASKERWGIQTETFTKVNTVMHSPNHWDDNAVGNKHVFFILDGCKNDEPTRGIYNEFLNSSLEQHRKVFEILGDKTKCQPTDEQLSGVGFSSTRGDTVTVRVKGAKLQKTFNIHF